MNINTITLTRSDNVATTSLVPMSNQNGLAVFQEDDAAKVVELREVLSVKLRPGKGAVKRKVTSKYLLPFRPADVDSLTQPIENMEGICTFNIPVNASTSDIEDLVVLTVRAVADDIIADIIENGRAPV